MSIVKLLGFETLTCGCLVGHYRDAGATTPVTYIEEKATTCVEATHRRNHALVARRRPTAPPAMAVQASHGIRLAAAR